ncbi:N-acetylglucosamine kinase [Streptosporangium longisporum]
MDVGGTSSRALLLDASGRRSGYGHAAGGNPAAHGNAAAVANIGLALGSALRGTDPALVAGAVVGLAGSGALERPVFDRMWAATGLRVAPRLVGDLGIAFAAGTAEPHGTVLIAGTGAIAARIEDGEPVTVADGLGWLLGDQGSGFWLGRRAARAAARALSRGDAGGTLTRLVMDALLDDTPPRPEATDPETPAPGRGVVGEMGDGAAGEMRALAIRLVVRAQSRPPLELARLAPLVARAAAEGDPVAREIVSTAARLLCETVAEVRPADGTGPIVLAGGVLAGDGPVGAAVRERLGSGAVPAGDGAGAAAWLAGREAFGWDPATAALLHARVAFGR